MTKKEVISDLTRLIKASSSLHEAREQLDRYMFVMSELDELTKWVEINDPHPVNTMRGAKYEQESDEFGGFGGGGFGGGGASGGW